MGRPALDDEAISAFRDRLCEVALAQFAELGYRAVSLRGIARALGVSHALVYRYFEAKADVFVAVRRRCLERFSAYQEARLAGLAEPAEVIREGARSYIDFAHDEPHAFRVMFDLEQPPPAELPALRDAHQRAFRILERVIEAALAAGVIAGPPAQLTQLFWAGVHGVATLHLSGQLAGRQDARALAGELAETLLRGMKP
jgi:AcrR family transcriptional regulator